MFFFLFFSFFHSPFHRVLQHPQYKTNQQEQKFLSKYPSKHHSVFFIFETFHTMMQTTPAAANTKEFSRNNWWFCGQGRINEACASIIMKAASASKQIAIGMAGVKANRFHGSVPDVVYFEDSMALPDWNTLGELLESEETIVLIATTCVPDRLMISAAPGEYKRILQSNLVDIRYVPPGCTFGSDFECGKIL